MTTPQGDFSLGNARGYVDIDPSGVREGLNEARQQLQGYRQNLGQFLTSTGRQVRDFGVQFLPLAATITATMGAGLNVAANFDESLIEIQARTGLTSDAMESVRQKALQLGADTVFSTQQAADAFLQLTTAGLSFDQVMRQDAEGLTILDRVLSGAAAAGADLGTTADQVTNIMAGFRLEVTDAAHIVDAMSQAAASSPASMTEMGEALQMAGGDAGRFGLSLDQTSAALAILANNGIRGSEAATQLRSMFTAMSAPTDRAAAAWQAAGTSLFDAEGNARDFNVVLEELEAGLANMSDQERADTIQALAGSYGRVGLNALLASDGVDAMVETMHGQASAADIAEQRMNSFKNQVNSLLGSVQALMITALTPFMNNVLRPIIELFIDATNGVTAWASANEGLVQNIMIAAGVFAGLVALLIIGGQAMIYIGAAIGFILSPIGLLIAGIAGLAFIMREQLGWALDFVIEVFNILFRGDFIGTGAFYEDSAFAAFFFGLREDIIATISFVQDFISGLSNAFQQGGLAQAGQFIQDNLITPIVDRFNSIDWSLVATNIVNGIGSGMSLLIGAGTWLYDNFVAPIITAAQNTDWNQVGLDVVDGIGAALAAYAAWKEWLVTNIYLPLIQNAATAISQVDWSQVGQNILDGIGTAITGVFDFVGWINQNILQPILTNAQTSIESVDWFSVGQSVVNAIGTALTATFDFVAWIIDSIFSPITTNTDTATGQVDWSGVGTSIMNGIGSFLSGVMDFINWFTVNVLAPLVLGAASAIQTYDWSSVGTNLMNALANALPNIANWVQTNIIEPIGNAMSGFNINNLLPNPPNLNQFNPFNGGGFQLPGFATGINFVPNNMIAQIHAGEAVIPADNNPYNPNASNPIATGNQGSNATNYYLSNFTVVTNDPEDFVSQLRDLVGADGEL